MVEQTSPAAALPLAINWQYVRDLSFESPRAPQIFVQQGQAPQVSIQVRVDARPIGENTFEIVLVIEASAKTGEEPVFLVELEYGGIFTAAAMPADALTPLLINPIDFAELYRQQLRQPRAQGEPSAAPTGTA